MATLKTWKTKNNKDKDRKYKRSVGVTDYDIPYFSYRSAFIILIMTLIPLFVIPFVCDLINIDFRIPTILLGGLISGFTTAYVQFFIERDTGFCRSFWIVGALLSCFIGLLIFFLIYGGILM